MKTVLHKASTRGHADHGWLNAHHTFSFNHYYDHERVNFGALRVLNDDWIAPAMGFDTHPHDNMEIITIPLFGIIEHKDSMGNHGTITAGEIQVMSAGTGIYHSEFNGHQAEPLSLLQIWVFANKKNVAPRYDKISLKKIEKKDALYQILSPSPDDQGLWIHQQAWFTLGDLSKNWKGNYALHRPKSGVYVFVIDGAITIAGEKLSKRDGIGISEISEIEITTSADTQLLIIEVPMTEV